MSFKTIAAVLQAPRSRYFSAALSGQTGHKTSYYATLSPAFVRSEADPFVVGSSLCFDVSNETMHASVSVDGGIQNALVERGFRPDDEKLRGVYIQKQLLGGGPWVTNIRLADRAAENTGVETTLIEALIPVASSRLGSLTCQVISFAPVPAGPETPLPAVIQVYALKNEGAEEVAVAVELPDRFPVALNERLAAAENRQSGVYRFDARFDPSGRVVVTLQPGEATHLAAAFLIGQTQEELKRCAAALAARSAEEWLDETLSFHTRRMGKLQIEDDYYAEGLVRFTELCRQSEMVLPDGSMGGGINGSYVFPDPDGWWNTNVWMKDNFYAALPMALFDPELCEKAILFFTQWGVPVRARGRGVRRYPNTDPLTNSASNSLSGLVLAGAYYQSTGNRQFFCDHPAFLERAEDLLARLMASRYHQDIFLFPSMYVSDGDSRGDFHTGTNAVAWYAFSSLARICAEAYGDPQRAEKYQTIADRVRRDLQAYCKGPGLLGEQYFEGAYRDGTFVSCKDGEESDVALMPFYGLCEVDDPALTRFLRQSFTRLNPFYNPEVDGIAWFDEGYCCHSTFPGFMSVIAGSQNEAELLAALERVRRLTDLDGSIWWWPHNLESHLPSQVVRWPLKSCWAAAVYVMQMVNDILGIRVDTPARTVRFSPFLPWKQFAWQDCRMGASTFDLSYEQQDGCLQARLTNRNESEFAARIELTLPEQAVPVSYQIDDEVYSEDLVRFRTRYGRPCIVSVRNVAPGATTTFRVNYTMKG